MALVKDDKNLQARVEDALRLSDERGYPHFVGFLDERQGAAAEDIAAAWGNHQYMLWGGYDDAERVFFGAFPPWQQPDSASFPVVALYITFRKQDSLSHRDFLGTLMGQGITRESVGDILVGEGKCVLFLKEEVAGFVRSQLRKVGGAGVTLEDEAFAQLPQGRGFDPVTDTVASPRLDCVLAALLRLGREKSAALIRSGEVAVNRRQVLSVSDPVREGDKISARKYGKFVIDGIGPPTKKGRLRLEARKYK